jgi:hypothetical protein
MSDLASLMKYAPGSAALMMGQNNAQSQQSEALKQQELKQLIAAKLQEMQQSQQMNPLKLEHQSLQNQGLSAGLPGIQADSQLKQLSSQFTQATQPGAIDAANSKSINQVDKDKHEMVGRFQNWAIETGTSLEGTPPLLRKQALVERMQAGGINPDNPMAKNLITELDRQDPKTWPSYFSTLADKLGAVTAKQNTTYRSATENNVRDNTQRNVDSQRRESTARYVADRSADSRVEAAKLRMSKDSKSVADVAAKMGYEKAAVYSSFKAIEAETKEEKDMWENRAAAYQEAHLKGKREAAAGRPNPEGVGIGTVAPQVTNLGPKAAGGAQVGPPGSPTNPIKLK